MAERSLGQRAPGGGAPAPRRPEARTIVYEARPAPAARERHRVGIVVLAALVLAWELASRAGWVSPLFLPGPTAVAAEAGRMVASGELGRHLGVSLLRIAAGFALGAAGGTVLGLVLGASPLAGAIGNPLIAATYPIPKIALLPLMILWLGIGEAPKVAMIALGVFFPVVINTYAGVRETLPLMVQAAVSLGARPRQVLTKVILPSALPTILAGYRLGAGIALLLVVSAEMINATAGVGFLILHAGDLMLTDKLMVGLVLLSVLGLASTWGLRALEGYLAPWREESR